MDKLKAPAPLDRDTLFQGVMEAFGHELRNRLTALSSLIQLSQRRGETSATDRLDQEIHRLTELVEEGLKLTTSPTASPGPFRLDHLVMEVLDPQWMTETSPLLLRGEEAEVCQSLCLLRRSCGGKWKALSEPNGLLIGWDLSGDQLVTAMPLDLRVARHLLYRNGLQLQALGNKSGLAVAFRITITRDNP